MKQKNESPKNSENKLSFQNKVWVATGIIALVTIVLLLLKVTISVFLLVLAGTLIAIFF
jgi:hypothetical protein